MNYFVKDAYNIELKESKYKYDNTYTSSIYIFAAKWKPHDLFLSGISSPMLDNLYKSNAGSFPII